MNTININRLSVFMKMIEFLSYFKHNYNISLSLYEKYLYKIQYELNTRHTFILKLILLQLGVHALYTPFELPRHHNDDRFFQSISTVLPLRYVRI
jgi:hypothetical protein